MNKGFDFLLKDCCRKMNENEWDYTKNNLICEILIEQDVLLNINANIFIFNKSFDCSAPNSEQLREDFKSVIIHVAERCNIRRLSGIVANIHPEAHELQHASNNFFAAVRKKDYQTLDLDFLGPLLVPHLPNLLDNSLKQFWWHLLNLQIILQKC